MLCKHNSDRKREFDTLDLKESVWFCLLWLLKQVNNTGVCILNWLDFGSCEIKQSGARLVVIVLFAAKAS